MWTITQSAVGLYDETANHRPFNTLLMPSDKKVTEPSQSSLSLVTLTDISPFHSGLSMSAIHRIELGIAKSYAYTSVYVCV